MAKAKKGKKKVVPVKKAKATSGKSVKSAAPKAAKKVAKIVAKAKPAKKPAKKSGAKSPVKVISKGTSKATVAKSASKVALKKSAPKVLADSKSAKTRTTSPKAPSDWSSYLTPLDDRVLVEMTSSERVTPGGLFIPDTAEVSGNFEGKVVAVGRGHVDKKGKLKPLELKVGDQVLLSQWAGSEVELEGQKLRLVRESEVLGTVA